MLLCALTGRVFEPVSLMKRGWNQKTQLGVYLPPGYPDIIPVYFVSTRRRCRVCAFSSGLHFPRTPLANLQPPLHLQPPSPIHSPLLWLTTHHPYQALHSLYPNPQKQDLHPLHTSLFQPLSVAWTRARRTHPRFARATGHHQAILQLQAP